MNRLDDCHASGDSRLVARDYVKRYLDDLLDTSPPGTSRERVIEAAIDQIMSHYALEWSPSEAATRLGAMLKRLRRGEFLPM